jgi:hypothetical protein
MFYLQRVQTQTPSPCLISKEFNPKHGVGVRVGVEVGVEVEVEVGIGIGVGVADKSSSSRVGG